MKLKLSLAIKVLPKFKQEASLSLKEDLQKLGLRDMFSSTADFSGISGGKELHVSHVVQKAFNEEGTDADSATAVLFLGQSSRPRFMKFMR